MLFEYHTQNLILKILSPAAENASAVLDFYSQNKDVFEPFEPARPENFYTEAYQNASLTCEFTLISKKEMLRFWVFEKNNPSQIIGTVSFFHIRRSVYACCETGYKFDQRYWHKGYAKEALAFGIGLMFEEYNLHRIEAFCMENNLSSIRLLKALGFAYEGTCRQSICVRGNWEDHMHFALLR